MDLDGIILTTRIVTIDKSKDGLYEPALADSEREAVADLLQYLENVRDYTLGTEDIATDVYHQRAETDFFSGDPLRSLSTLVYSENVDLQRSASLTFAEITERGTQTPPAAWALADVNFIDVREVDRETLEPILYLLQSSDIEVQRAASAALGNLAVNSTRISRCMLDLILT